MAVRNKPTGLLKVGKRLERVLRWCRQGIKDACAARNIVRAAGRFGPAELVRLAAGLNPSDVIICCSADAPTAADDCVRCLDSLAGGLLPPRRVTIIAAAGVVAAVRRCVGLAMHPTASPLAADLRFIEDLGGTEQTFLSSLQNAVSSATTEHVLLCDARATVCDDALLWIAATLERDSCPEGGRDVQAIYADDAAAAPSAGPQAAAAIHHKPDFSWVSLLGGSYLGPIVLFRRSLAAAALDRLISRSVATASTGEALYAVALEALRGCAGEDVSHIRHPLSLRPRENVTAAGDDTAGIASEVLDAAGVSAAVSAHPRDASLHRFELHPQRTPHVSIVIPTKNAGSLVTSCVSHLRERAGYDAYDVTVIDHDSHEPELLDFLSRESAADRLRVFPYRGPFNFAAMNNAAVQSTRGSLLLFLNNDVDGFTPRWLEQMAATFELDDRIGAVGALLHYPEGDVQHAGVVLNAKRLCQHAHYNWPADALGYQGRIHRLQEYSAVTAALMLVRRDAFDAVGGFDEQFPDDYNDIDLCLRLKAAGFSIVYQPHVQATHWEGRTRTARETAREVFVARWQHAFPCDPFYHPHLATVDFRPDGLERFWLARKTLALGELLADRDRRRVRPPQAREDGRWIA